MRIFVFGNINAGKTHIVLKLKDSIWKSYPLFSIDLHRMQYGDGTIQGELHAQEHFVEDVYNCKDCIVECTGLGPLGHKLHDKLDIKNDIVIYVNTIKEVCIHRLRYKDLSAVPYPPVDEDITDTIIRCAQEFEDGLLHELWKDKIIQIFDISDSFELENIPFRLLITFSKIVDYLYTDNKIKTIFPYGSLARNEMTEFSDIDCFIVTEMDVEEFINLLKYEFDFYFIDYIHNKVTIRDENNHLIELVLIKKLIDGHKYIHGLSVDACHNAAIKISKEDQMYVDTYEYEPLLEFHDLQWLTSEMLYFVYSLPTLIKTNNRYKYYFHTNIIIHNYIRINEILNGRTYHNYLPHIVWEDYINILDVNQLDLEEHYKAIKEEVKKLLILIKKKSGFNYTLEFN